MVDCLTQMALPLIKKEIILSRVVVAFRFLILLASFLRKFGSEKEGNGQFNPLGVGVLANGNVVVGDYLRAKCQIFDSVGNFVSVFGAGILFSPNHLFVDSDDNILVASGKSIEVFNSDGTHLKTIGRDVISSPSDVCIWSGMAGLWSVTSRNTRFLFFEQTLEGKRESSLVFLWLKKWWWC